MTNTVDLKSLLNKFGCGQIVGKDKDNVEKLLTWHWSSLDGSTAGGMSAAKLQGRTEALVWTPPTLTFSIERHGATVLGSSRAEIQHWEVNLENATARLIKTGWRQIYPMARRMDVRPIAEEIARAILNGIEIDSLKWISPDEVKILTSVVIPATNQQTTTARRQRLLKKILELVEPHGWRRAQTSGFPVLERSGHSSRSRRRGVCR